MTILCLCLFGWLLLTTPLKAGESPSVTVFEASRIITMEPSQPDARFVAVADGIILGTADSLEALSPWTRNRQTKIDRRFAGKILMPGLIDPHIHPMQAAVMLNLPFLAPEDWTLPTGQFPGAQTPEAYRQRLREMLTRSTADPFIIWGHHDLFHGTIDRRELDRMAPDRAVIIWQRSFHEIIANSKAMKGWGFETSAALEAARIAAKANPEHLDYARGLFSETALPIAIEKMRPVLLTPDRIRFGMAAMQSMMLANGVTTVSDMATGIFASFDVEARLIKAAFDRPDNPSRVMLMPMASSVPADQSPSIWLKAISDRYASSRVRIDRRVKMLADGAFFAQNMMMNAPGYTDGHSGKWITAPDVLKAQFGRFWDSGFDLHVHVNGDQGLDVVLDAIAALRPSRNQTVTLEHLGYSTEAQNQRLAGLGLMVSAQPNYIRVLGDAYARNGLGTDRAAVINRLGSLERKGVTLGLHSDFNMAPINPLYLAWIATNRITIGGTLMAPTERLSLDKALRAITIEAAKVIGMETLIGSIAPGKYADFAVLDQDPYEYGAARLRDVEVAGVIFEGRYYPSPAAQGR